MAVLKVQNGKIIRNNPVLESVAQTSERIVDAGLKADTTSFTGRAPNVQEVSEMISEYTPGFLNGMKKMKDNISEFQNIMINSLGTGLIAPIFIKWNPLSKTDEDTRTYTAWRQPVSAALAIGTQAAITLPFAHAIKNMAKEGMFSEKLNETPYKNADEFLKNLRDKNKIVYTTKNLKGITSTSNMDEQSLNNLINHTFDDLIASEEKAIKHYSEYIKQRASQGEYFSKNADSAKEYFSKIQTELKDISSSKDARLYFNKQIKDLKNSNADKELVSMVENLRDMAAYNPKTKPSVWDKIFRRKPNIENAEEINKTVIELINSEINKITKENGLIDKYRGKTAEEIQEIAKNSLKQEVDECTKARDYLKTLKGNFAKNKLTVKDIEKNILNNMSSNGRFKNKEFAKEILATLKKYTGNNISVFKQISGMGVSLAMLPVTCALLNWVYPRFMDIFFPGLSSRNKAAKANAEKGGDK